MFSPQIENETAISSLITIQCCVWGHEKQNIVGKINIIQGWYNDIDRISKGNYR